MNKPITYNDIERSSNPEISTKIYPAVDINKWLYDYAMRKLMHSHYCYMGRHYFQDNCMDFDIDRARTCGNYKYDDFLRFWRNAFPVELI